MDQLYAQVDVIIEGVGLLIEVVGVGIIVLGFIWAFYNLFRNRQQEPHVNHYQPFRKRIGHILLLGLEILVAADIVKTIAIDLNLESIAVLAGLVLVRTFVSWTLILEIERRWPWQSS